MLNLISDLKILAVGEGNAEIQFCAHLLWYEGVVVFFLGTSSRLHARMRPSNWNFTSTGRLLSTRLLDWVAQYNIAVVIL